MTSKYYQLPKPSERKSLSGSLQLKERPIPKPSETEILIKVHATSINFRDFTMAIGTYPLPISDEACIPLSDGAGEVIDVGSKVKKWRKGDKVVSIFNGAHQKGSDPDDEEAKTGLGGGWDGMLAQHVVLPQDTVVRIPAHLSYEEAATLTCAAVTAYNGLYGMPGHTLRAGQAVLLEGTGGVSVFALQLAAAAGARVVITSSSDDKLETVKKHVGGIENVHFVNYSKTPDWDKEALKLIGPADHVLEVGGHKTVGKAFNALKRGGVVSSIGWVGGATETVDTLALTLVKNAILRGLLVGSRQMFEDMNQLISTHKLKPVIDKVFGFGDAKSAYQYMVEQKHVGKIVIRV